MHAEYDREADAAYVYFPGAVDTPVGRTLELDGERMIDYAADGSVVGVEFLSVSDGVRLEGVPRANEVSAALHAKGITTLQPVA
jgi:uncharacterized protein YuzE